MDMSDLCVEYLPCTYPNKDGNFTSNGMQNQQSTEAFCKIRQTSMHYTVGFINIVTSFITTEEQLQ